MKPFLAHLAEDHVRYCHHLASVVRIKLGMNVPWGIVHRTDVGIFDPLKNMATVTKNRT